MALVPSTQTSLGLLAQTALSDGLPRRVCTDHAEPFQCATSLSWPVAQTLLGPVPQIERRGESGGVTALVHAEPFQ